MSRARPGLVSELVPVLLIVLAVAGSLGLVIAMHERAAAPVAETQPIAPPPAPKPAPPPPVAVIAPPPAPKPKPKPKPKAPVEDPTKPILAALAAEEAKERAAAKEADRTASAFEAARLSAVSESERWRRREALARAQVNKLADQAGTIEAQADGLAAELDVLARQKAIAKTDLAQSLARAGGYAVLPHKGVHGTWQRPVMIECREGLVVLQPGDRQFGMTEMSPDFNIRVNPLVAAVARELMKVQRTTSPDGDPVVPYIYFLVRPDGVRSYYEARGRLEPLGIAFGYELIDQDWKVEFPDFDSLESWDGLKPLRSNPSLALESAPGSGGGGRANGTGLGGAKGNEFVWPVDRVATSARGNGNGNGTGRGVGSGNGGGGGSGKDSGSPFLWPTQPPGGAPGNEGPGGMADAEGDEASPGLGGTAAGTLRGLGSAPGGGLAAGSGGGGAIFAPRYGTGGGGSSSGARGSGTGIDLGPLTPPAPGADMGGRGRTSPSLPQLVGDPRRRGLPAGGTGGTPGLQPPTIPRFGTGSGGGSSPPSGLIPVDPSQLPGLAAADGNGGGGGAAAPAAGSGTGMPPLTSAPPAEGTGLRPPPNRVRIDPRLLAYADEGQQILDKYHDNDPSGGPGDDPSTGTGGGTSPNEPNAAGGSPGTQPASRPSQGPIGAGSGGTGRGTGSGTGSSASGTPGQASGASGAPSSGFGASSSAGGGQPSGTVGVGMPSMSGMTNGGNAAGAGAGSSSSDSRPKPAGNGGRPSVPQDRLDIAHRTVYVPLRLVVACGPAGVTIHPGGYRLSRKTLAKKDLLATDLQTIVRNHALIDANVRPKPSLEFLVEPGGAETYAEARKQTVLSGLPWPVTFRVAESSIAQTFPKERF